MGSDSVEYKVKWVPFRSSAIISPCKQADSETSPHICARDGPFVCVTDPIDGLILRTDETKCD